MPDNSTSPDPATTTPLTYEEMPVVEPSVATSEPQRTPSPNESDDRERVIPEASRVFGASEPPHDASTEPNGAPESFEKVHSRYPSGGGKRYLGTILFVLLLFGLGLWLSGQLRSFFAPATSDEVVIPTIPPFAYPTTVLTPGASPSGSITSSTWQTLSITSGATKKAIPGISYRLPEAVKAPVCDSASCASMGTNLPGGTRFTVAPRGKGQILPDFRGAILTDTTGKEFVMKQTTIGQLSVYEYTGNFTGRTGGGYTFTNMRGALVPVSETLAVDFNHFAPTGVTTDFVKDDLLFDEIVKSFQSSITLPLISPTTKPSTASAGF